MLSGIPVVESLIVKHILFVVTVVILVITEYLESQSMSSTVFELPKVDIAVYPHSLVAKPLCDMFGFIQTLWQFDVVVVYSTFEEFDCLFDVFFDLILIVFFKVLFYVAKMR